jgi:hypothetical protein
MWKAKGKNYHINTFLGRSLSKSLEEAMDLSQDRLLLEKGEFRLLGGQLMQSG